MRTNSFAGAVAREGLVPGLVKHLGAELKNSLLEGILNSYCWAIVSNLRQ